MTLYPEVQRKAQAEIDRVIGNARLPVYSDEDSLPYIQAMLKEVLRWHPVTPLSKFSSSYLITPPHYLAGVATEPQRAMSTKVISFPQVQ